MRQTFLKQRYPCTAGQDCSATTSPSSGGIVTCSCVFTLPQRDEQSRQGLFGQKYFHHFGKGLSGPRHDAICVQAAHRVGHDCKGVIWDAPYLCYRPAGIGERLGAYSGGGFARFLYCYGIVHTARTAGASITCGSYHQVTLLQQLIHNGLGSRAGLVPLVKADYLFNLIGILD